MLQTKTTVLNCDEIDWHLTLATDMGVAQTQNHHGPKLLFNPKCKVARTQPGLMRQSADVLAAVFRDEPVAQERAAGPALLPLDDQCN